MSKIEINNELVLMRHLVRQAKVNVIRKLVREAKALRAKRGTEIQQNKCKRKADRLTEEVLAAKKLKDDDISKFVITNKKSVQEVLTDKTSDASTRIMVKLGNYKSLVDRVATIKEKFPSYEEHLGPGRKKMVKLQRKANRLGQKAEQSNELKLGSNGEKEIENDAENVEQNEMSETQHTQSFDGVVEDSTMEEHSLRNEVKKNDTDSDSDEVSLKCDSEPGSKLRTESEKKSVKQKRPNIKIDKTQKAISTKNKLDTEVNALKIISKEATVKRFTDLLQEEYLEMNTAKEASYEGKEGKLKIEKEVDPFFMTGEGDTEYLSVVVPKATPLEDSEEGGKYYKDSGYENTGKKFSKSTFFTNLDRPSGKSEYSKYNGSGDWRYESAPQKRPGRDFTSKTKPRNDRDPAKKARTEFSDRSQNRSEKMTDSGDSKLHPSWAARKKQQELMKQGFQGQKIVFSDD